MTRSISSAPSAKPYLFALFLLLSICCVISEKVDKSKYQSGMLKKIEILETGELKKKELILAASNDAIFAGANFIKTSTGKTDIGVTKEAVEVMLQAIQLQKTKF